MSLRKPFNVIKICHVAEGKVYKINLGDRNLLSDYATAIEDKIGGGFKFEDMRFVNCAQPIENNTDLRTLMNKGSLDFVRMFPKKSSLTKPEPIEEKFIFRKPLDFVIMKDKQIYDRIEMDDATTSTTILGIYKYLCKAIKGNWSVLAMHIDEYGTTRELFRNERMDLKSEANEFLLYKIGQFEGDNNILVTIRDDSYKAVYNTTKSLVTVNLHIHDTEIKMPAKGDSLRLRVTDHYNITFNVTCSTSATVKDILKNICARGGYSPETAKLYYFTKKLSSKSRISDHNIRENQELQVKISMKGGYSNLNMVDVEKGVTIEREWSQLAPKWRVVNKGLVVEGVCTNETCEAFMKRVCCSLGFGRVRLVIDERKIVCPLCEIKIKPQDIAFNNCFYTIQTRKLEGEVLTSRTTVEGVAGDVYTTFDKAKCGEALFFQFKIKTEERRPGDNGFKRPVPKFCGICGDSLDVASAFELDCCHAYHRSCIFGANEGSRLEICPYCESNTLVNKQ